MKRSVKINVYGMVQGVGYRYNALQKANELGLKGFVKNRVDGSVYMEVEAEDALLQEFLFWCRQGPSRSRVDKVNVLDIPFSNYSDFKVK